ncbi:MAG: hypothetical protein ACTSRE_12505 [Promethearchaeota archaeon]
MIIYAVYVITEGGELMYSESFQTTENKKDLDLVSGLLTALRMFATEVTQADVKAFEVEGLTYHFQSFNIFYVVLVTSSLEGPQEYLHQLGLRFMKKFGEQYVSSNKTYDFNFFQSFKSDVEQVLGSIVDVTSSINPTKKLTTAEIFNLPKETQKVALALLQLEESTVQEIAVEVNMNEENTITLLDQLIKIGFIGKKSIDEKITYFCAI